MPENLLRGEGLVNPISQAPLDNDTQMISEHLND
jgi:hypothetical protein